MSNSFNMSDIFSFQLPRKILFGNGAIQKIGEEANALCTGRKVLLVTDKDVLKAGLAESARQSLEKSGFEIIIFDGVVPDSPFAVIESCVDFARQQDIDIIFGFGGGSSIDTAKAVSLMVPYKGDMHDFLGLDKVKAPGLPTIFVPTTAGTGSEISNAFVVIDDRTGEKFGCYSPHAFADLAIIDPELTLTMPPALTAECGMDAFSHALESFVTIKANPLSEVLSSKAIELIPKNILKVYKEGLHDIEARYAMCLGTCLGTMAIRSSGLGLIHATSNPVVMKAHVAHGTAISLMMPAVMDFNLNANPEKFAAIASAMGETVNDLSATQAAVLAAEAVRLLIRELKMPSRLRDVGIKKSDLPGFADTVMQRSRHLIEINPRHADKSDLIAIYESAW